jgi:hypothetical protein
MYTATQAQGSDISYSDLSRRVWPIILANQARTSLEFDDIEEYAWTLYVESEDENEEWYYVDTYQSYIITQSGADYLKEHTDEVVIYSESLDLYFWEITHYGTAWSHVFTSVKE